MKKGFYRFFAHASQGSHEEITPHPIAPTSRSKKYNHQRDGIETESESEAPRLTRYEKDRLRLGSKKIVAVGYVGMCDRGIDVVNMILEKKLFEAHVERVDKWDLDSVYNDNFIYRFIFVFLVSHRFLSRYRERYCLFISFYNIAHYKCIECLR